MRAAGAVLVLLCAALPAGAQSDSAIPPAGGSTQPAAQTGKSYATVLADMERDFWMNAEEAVKYGIVSRIIDRQKDLG